MSEQRGKNGDKKPKRYTEIASIVVTTVWLAAMFSGQSWWLVALLGGYVGVVPLVAILTGEDEDEEEDEEGALEDLVSEEERREMSRPKRDALEVLRERYSYGELTEEQFERKVEVLLDTETLEDAEEWVLHGASSATPDAFEELEQEQVEAQHSAKKSG